MVSSTSPLSHLAVTNTIDVQLKSRQSSKPSSHALAQGYKSHVLAAISALPLIPTVLRSFSLSAKITTSSFFFRLGSPYGSSTEPFDHTLWSHHLFGNLPVWLHWEIPLSVGLPFSSASQENTNCYVTIRPPHPSQQLECCSPVLPLANMHNLIRTSYLLPAIFLNPVLFLHTLNTILSRILPPIVVSATTQPPPYSDLGPSACHPHFDIHSSESFCWSYTIVMVCAQLMAFGRVSRCREQGRERRRIKEELALANSRPLLNGDTKHVKGRTDVPNGLANHVSGGKDPPDRFANHMNGSGLRKLSAIREESYFN